MDDFLADFLRFSGRTINQKLRKEEVTEGPCRRGCMTTEETAEDKSNNVHDIYSVHTINHYTHGDNYCTGL